MHLCQWRRFAFILCFVSSYEKMLIFFQVLSLQILRQLYVGTFPYSFKAVVSSGGLLNAKPLIHSWNKPILSWSGIFAACCTPFARTSGSRLCCLCRWVELAERPAHMCPVVTYGFSQIQGSTKWSCNHIPLHSWMICARLAWFLPWIWWAHQGNKLDTGCFSLSDFWHQSNY